ncbi:glycine rich domain-containing protein [Segatella albensis]|uniref:glycine rich domain-containing protein n=1 Tax=Segatella albensis TaxID=77768 RepID=UPI0004694297|nr:glycine rich domain-containing protein [Segatella albensis]
MQTFTAPLATTYKIECWGASGGVNGNGAYTIGYIDISKNFILYVYVGERGMSSQSDYNKPQSGTFNGGGGFTVPNPDKYNGTGGGATDIRLQNGNWDNFNSLKSRIMVAAGAGSCIAGNPSSYGGALSTPNYTNTHTHPDYNTNAAQGATQTSGYKFGIGQDGGRAGAGGGYYGGYATVRDESNVIGIRGTGGSSFISGYPGCNAISESSTEDNIIHTGQPNHYSGYVFSNSVMIAGNASMPKPKGGTEQGHSGDGYAIISWISPSL